MTGFRGPEGHGDARIGYRSWCLLWAAGARSPQDLVWGHMELDLSIAMALTSPGCSWRGISPAHPFAVCERIEAPAGTKVEVRGLQVR